MNIKILMLLLSAMMLLGCSGSKEEPPLNGHTSKIQTTDPNAVLVAVNGRELLQKDAVERVKNVMGPPPPGIPKGRALMIQKRALAKVIDEFVSQSLLADAAIANGIEVTQAEQDMALNKLKAKLPKDKSLEDVIGDTESQQKMKATMIEGIRVQKLITLLRQENGPLSLPSDKAATDESIDAYLKANPKATQNRDEIIKHLRRQQERQLFIDYLRSLHDAADIKHAASVIPPKTK